MRKNKEIELSIALEKTKKIARPNTILLHAKTLKTLGYVFGHTVDPKSKTRFPHKSVIIDGQELRAITIPTREKERFACVNMEIII